LDSKKDSELNTISF